MSLNSLKKRLNFDQRNRITVTVVSNSADTVTVRMPDGKMRQAVKTNVATSYVAGDLVEITTTDRKVLSVDRLAPLRPTGGVVVKSV